MNVPIRFPSRCAESSVPKSATSSSTGRIIGSTCATSKSNDSWVGKYR